MAVQSEIARSSNLNSKIQNLTSEEKDKILSKMEEELNLIKSSNAENLNSLNKSLVYSIQLKDQLEKAEKESSAIRPELEKLREKDNSSAKINIDNLAIVKFKDTKFVEDVQKYSLSSITIYGKLNLNNFAGKFTPQVIIEDYEIEKEIKTNTCTSRRTL